MAFTTGTDANGFTTFSGTASTPDPVTDLSEFNTALADSNVDVINVQSGITINLSGTKTISRDGVAIVGESPTRPIFQGKFKIGAGRSNVAIAGIKVDAQNGNDGIAVEGISTNPAKDVLVEDCEIINGNNKGIASKYVERITIKRCIIRDCKQDGIWQKLSSFMKITECVLYDNGTRLDKDHGCYTSSFNDDYEFSYNASIFNKANGLKHRGPSRRNAILYNIIAESGQLAISHGAKGDGGDGPYGKQDSIIHGNVILKQGSHGVALPQALTLMCSNNNTISYNIMANPSATKVSTGAFKLLAPVGYESHTLLNCLIHNNIVFEWPTRVFNFQNGVSSSGTVIRDNVFAIDSSDEIIVFKSPELMDSITFTGNQWHCSKAAPFEVQPNDLTFTQWQAMDDAGTYKDNFTVNDTSLSSSQPSYPANHYPASGWDTTLLGRARLSWSGDEIPYTHVTAAHTAFSLTVPAPVFPWTAAPRILSVTATSTTAVEVAFNQAIDDDTIATGDFVITGSGPAVATSTATRRSTNFSIVDLVVATLTAGTEYTMTVDNVDNLQGETIASGSSQVFAWITDTAPPKIDSVTAAEANTQVIVTFDEAVEELTAETIGNYVITSPALNVTGAVRHDTNTDRVTLTVDAMITGVTYLITITNVEDTSGNAITAGNSKEYDWTGGTAPSIVAANVIDSTTVDVLFDEPLNKVSAEKKANYAVDGSITVSDAALQDGLTDVRLTVSALTADVTYTVTVNDVEDIERTPIADDSTTTFKLLPTITALEMVVLPLNTILGDWQGDNP